MDNTYLRGRITATKALIEAYEGATTALAGGVQSYTLDTGQSRQTVTKLDLKDLNNMLDNLYNRLSTMEARLNGSGTVIARPGF